jgi:hypothetical protein
MATDLAKQQVVLMGLGPAYTLADPSGMTITGAAGCVLHVRNGSASATTLTIVPSQTVDGLSLRSIVVSIPAGGNRFYGPLPDRLLDASGNLAFAVTGADISTVDMTVLTV